MSDLAGQIGGAEEEVVVLAAVKGRAEPTGFVEELTAHHGEMAHVVAAFHQLRRPVRLEVREHAPAPRVEPILI